MRYRDWDDPMNNPEEGQRGGSPWDRYALNLNDSDSGGYDTDQPTDTTEYHSYYRAEGADIINGVAHLDRIVITGSRGGDTTTDYAAGGQLTYSAGLMSGYGQTVVDSSGQQYNSLGVNVGLQLPGVSVSAVSTGTFGSASDVLPGASWGVQLGGATAGGTSGSSTVNQIGVSTSPAITVGVSFTWPSSSNPDNPGYSDPGNPGGTVSSEWGWDPNPTPPDRG